jgi:hypothetical protein
MLSTVVPTDGLRRQGDMIRSGETAAADSEIEAIALVVIKDELLLFLSKVGRLAPESL